MKKNHSIIYLAATLMLLLLLTSNVKAQENVFVRFRDSDPKIASYSYDQMMKALMIDKYQEDFKTCAVELKKYFLLESHKEIIDKPSQDAFFFYLRSFDNVSSPGLGAYVKELMPGVEYNAGQYGAAKQSYENYSKMGINLRDESANVFASIFYWYRQTRLETGSASWYVAEKIDAADFNKLKTLIKNRWGSKLGPQPNYLKVIEDFYEVQLMIYMEKKLAAIFQLVFNSAKSTVPSCKELFVKALKEATQCYPGSYPAWNPQTQRTECFCETGLVWNSTRTACVDPQELVKNTDCSKYPGSYAAWNAQNQRVECWCPTGKKWNSTMTACIDIDKVGQSSCNEADAASFAKLTGTWKSYRMHVTIDGSCDNVSGTYKVTEWCEGVDETYNASVARVNGTFSGKMQNGYLQVTFVSPPSPNNSKGATGPGTCSIKTDGSLSCSFGCTGDLKKQ